MSTNIKHLFSLIIAVFFSISAIAQSNTTKKPAQTSKKPASSVKTNTPAMKNALDSFSYALGLSMAGFYKEQGVENINTALVTKALNDMKAGKPMLNPDEINNTIISFMQAAKSKKAEPSKKLGQAFLDSNKTTPGVVVLPSGLQYKIIKEGSGPKPGPNDRVRVHYEGSLLNGKIFDSSIQRGEPAEFGVSEVIPGWTEALQLMPVGSKWKVFIPSDLGYGDAGAGADIEPGATLIFDVELLEILNN